MVWMPRARHLGAEAHLFGALGPDGRPKDEGTQILFVAGLKIHSGSSMFASIDQEIALLPREER